MRLDAWLSLSNGLILGNKIMVPIPILVINKVSYNSMKFGHWLQVDSVRVHKLKAQYYKTVPIQVPIESLVLLPVLLTDWLRIL